MAQLLFLLAGAWQRSNLAFAISETAPRAIEENEFIQVSRWPDV
jgi:hypothetical protein